MKKNNKKYLFTAVLLVSALLTGCGKDAELDKFYGEMEDFTTQVNASFDTLNNVDPESETSVEDMLAAMDDLAAKFTLLAEIDVPRQFSAVEDLADEAGEYMAEAASLYREAYGGEYNENVASAALEYYNRAVKRLDYISQILQGELPTDASITIITENEAPGFKEDSQEDSGNTGDPDGEPEGTDTPSESVPSE